MKLKFDKFTFIRWGKNKKQRRLRAGDRLRLHVLRTSEGVVRCRVMFLTPKDKPLWFRTPRNRSLHFDLLFVFSGNPVKAQESVSNLVEGLLLASGLFARFIGSVPKLSGEEYEFHLEK